jgi:predicted MFS family arabinose efflux permease
MGGAPRLLAALGVTQILGWGSTYFLPGVLGGPMEAALGLPPGAAFSGIALQLGLAGLLAPAAGRFIERHGARPAMATGSVLMAAGLALLALAQGPGGALLACLVLGAGGALALTEAATAALAALGREGARQRLGLMAVMSGLSSLVAWPAFAGLEAAFGWRGAVWAAAAVHLLVALPLHLLALPAGRGGARAPRAAAAALPLRLRWLSAALTLQVLVGSAILANMVGLVTALGLQGEAAIWWAALIGPSQVAARLLDLAGGARISAVRLASGAMLLMPLTLLLPLVEPGAIPVFIIAYGLASGIMSVMRPACLIEMHGTEGYAAVAGRVMAPVTGAMAIGPALFAPLLQAAGPGAALGLAGALMLLAFALLRRAARSV